MASKDNTKLQNIIDKALQGDKDALDYLHVMDMSCKWKKAIVVSWEKLCVDYKDTAAAYNAASEHKMEHLKRALKTNLMYLTYIAKKVFKCEFDVDVTKVEAKQIIEHMQLQTAEVPPARLASY